MNPLSRTDVYKTGPWIELCRLKSSHINSGSDAENWHRRRRCRRRRRRRRRRHWFCRFMQIFDVGLADDKNKRTSSYEDK